MKRISLALAAALTCLLVASVGTASAMPTEESIDTTCNTNSKNVIGKKVTVKVAGKNVDPSQMRYADCGIVKKVAKGCSRCGSRSRRSSKASAARRPCSRGGEGTEEPQVVKYSCLFRGADTATEIRLTFRVNYNMD